MIQPRIVLLGGGTGSFTLLPGLKQLTHRLTAIVTMSDDGGSTGALRDELGVLPAGDVRQCLVALSELPEVRDLFSYRFDKGSFKGQSLGNIILSGLELQYGNFEQAVAVASELLRITGRVVPGTLERTSLVLRDGRRTIRGQSHVTGHSMQHPPVRLWLEPSAALNPAAARAINQADMVVIAPGNFYGSLVPLMLVDGLPTALRDSKARVVSVTNLVNKPGQCDGWHVADYVRHTEQYLGPGAIDTVIYNNQTISPYLLKRYAAAGEYPVMVEAERFGEIKAAAIGAGMVSKEIARQDPADTTIQRTLIRHDATAVADELKKLLPIA